MAYNPQTQVACAFAQFGAMEEVKALNGGWAEELESYEKMAEGFEQEHQQKGLEMTDEDYWDSVDFYDALDVYWSAHKEEFFELKSEEAS